jgi:hypothetical protein
MQERQTPSRPKETISAAISAHGQSSAPQSNSPDREEMFINTIVLHQKDAKFHLETDMALQNAFQVTDIIKDELVDANRDIENLRQ